MKKNILILFIFAVAMSLYSHGGGENDRINNKVLFNEGDSFEIREVTVTNWDFSEMEIVLEKNVRTRLIFKVESGHHGIQVRGLDLKSGNMKIGDKVIWDLEDLDEGEYSFYCNVYCGQGHSSMRGKLVVR